MTGCACWVSVNVLTTLEFLFVRVMVPVLGMVVVLGCAGAVIVYGSYVYLEDSGCKMGICVVNGRGV